MTTTVKWVSTGIWALLSLLAIALVGYFVTSQPEVPPAKGFLALPSVDSVAKATEEIGQIKWDLTQFRQAVDQLKDLEKTANPKEFDEFKQQIAVIATSINQAANQDEGRWKEISEKAGKVAAESKKLGEEAEAVRNTLKSLQTEGTQWKASLISNLLWFLLLSALLVTLFVSPNLTGMMQFVVRFVRGVKVPGFELSFTEDSGQKNRDIHLWFSEAFDELRGQAKKALRLFAEQQDIDQVFRSTVNRILTEVRSRQNTTLPVVQGAAPPTAGNAAVDGVRSTLHVRDVVFKDYLCQLLDYYPRRPAGGRAGRAWPVCYGMIGRVWRSEKSELRSLGAPSHGTSINQTLIDEYAMTEEQVRELVGNGRSFLCLLLRDTNRNLLGVLYMDAPGEKVFGEYPDPANPHSAVREGIAGSNFDSLLVHCAELVKKLSVYSDKVYGKAPLIEVMETHES